MTQSTRLKRVAGYVAVGGLGIVIGGILLFVTQVRRGPALEPWHTAELSQEFTVARASEIQSLDAYLALEDRVFQQVDELIYAVTDTGPGARLARFSAGSLPDPRGRVPNWNRTYELTTAQPLGAVLMLHGLSDSPYSLRALAEGLHTQGYSVLGLRLPGHGTAPSGLRRATWEDMAAAAQIGLDHLQSRWPGTPIHIVGYSTGAGLALHHTLGALDGGPGPIPASLVLISPAIGVTPLAALAKWNRRLARLPGLKQLEWQNNLPEFDPYKYGSFTFNSGDQVYRLTRTVATAIEERAREGGLEDFPPTLAFLSAADATVSAGAVVDNLFEHLPPDRGELVLFDVNRNSAGSTVLTNDPGPLTNRILANRDLPFDVTLVGNEDPGGNRVVVRHRPAGSADLTTEALELEWPDGVISLSHVALPFPPDDPLYGERPVAAGGLYLGRLNVQGERGLLLFPPDWLLRIRHNPFYDYLEDRAFDWIKSTTAPESPEP